jgi:exoribonuclease-2
MERFWTLQYLMQNQITELDAAVFKENMVRAESLPLVLMVAGARDLPRGARVRVRLGDIDSIALDVSGTVVERLDAAAQEVDAGSDDEGDDDAIAGPIAIAVDMGEGTDARPEGGDNPDS